MKEFLTTTSKPVGHGFTQANLDNDFACYSFEPKANLPLKVIVLDDTVGGLGKNLPQPYYARGALDQRRLDWLTAQLDEGQSNNKLMIIAAHIPIDLYCGDIDCVLVKVPNNPGNKKYPQYQILLCFRFH